MFAPVRNIPVPNGKVAEARAQFERQGTNPNAIINNLMENMERIQPGHRELIEKEKPIIAELMVKLRNREHDREYEVDNSVPMASEMSIGSYESSSSISDAAPPQFEPKAPQLDEIPQSPKRTRSKTPLEKCLANPTSREKFRELMESKGALENLEFWEACEKCERKAHGCATLAKKIIGQIMGEIKESHGHPEQTHMDLALNSAVVAVRYEIMLHKEETRGTAREIVDKFVRDNAPSRVNLTTERRNALIKATESKALSDHQLLVQLVKAQHEIRDLMERRYFTDFSG